MIQQNIFQVLRVSEIFETLILHFLKRNCALHLVGINYKALFLWARAAFLECLDVSLTWRAFPEFYLTFVTIGTMKCILESCLAAIPGAHRHKTTILCSKNNTHVLHSWMDAITTSTHNGPLDWSWWNFASCANEFAFGAFKRLDNHDETALTRSIPWRL